MLLREDLTEEQPHTEALYTPHLAGKALVMRFVCFDFFILSYNLHMFTM